MSIFRELKRRNVFRVGIAYVAVSWVLLQAGDVVFDFLELPAAAGKFLLAFLGLLMFPVLFFSWAYEITPDGIKKESEIERDNSITRITGRKLNILTIGLVIFGVAFVLIDRALLQRHVNDAASEAKLDAATVVAEQNSIAVLPFADMSPDGDQEYFSDGISEELLNLLVGVDGLKVASRTSSFAYKGENLNLTKIAKELQVSHVLEGSVRKAGNRVRITAQLIDASNDRHLWSDTFDRELDDIFAIQSEIANSIVDALRDTLGIETEDAVITVEAATSNLDAYDLFLKGREMFIARSGQNLPVSIEIVKQAVELDPNFARAWELLGALYSVAPSWGVGDAAYYELSRQAIDRALELEPNLAFAYGVKSQTLRSLGGNVNWTDAMALINKALELEPKNPTMLLWRGINYHQIGFLELAADDFDRCLELDPGYENCTNHRTMIFYNQGAADKGLERFDLQLAIARVKTTHWYQYQVPDLVRNGDLRAARLAAGSFLDDNPAITAWIEALLHPDEDQSERIELLAKRMDESDRAAQFIWMTTGAYDRVEPGYFTYISMWRTDLENFRQSDDFNRVMREGGVEDYWRAHGFPPQCRATGDDDFVCD